MAHNSDPPPSLFKSILDSPGMKHLGRMKVRAFTLHIFRRNLSELKAACSQIEDPQRGMKMMSEVASFQTAEAGSGNFAVHMEAIRLFHNMLASAKSLVDHTRVFMEEHYRKTELAQRYQKRVQQEVAEVPLVKFVQDLRNYMLHRGLPSVPMSFSMTRKVDGSGHEFESTISLPTASLVAWDGWTKHSKTYIREAGERIKVSELAEAYGTKILDLHEWLTEQISTHHKVDLEELERLQAQYAESEGRRVRLNS